MGRIGVGILGMGGISRLHVAGYQRNENVEIKAICDCSREAMVRAKRELRMPDVAEYEDYRRLLAREDVAAVTICVPNHLHAELALAALAAGKHVLCEKPLCLTLEECRALVAAARASGTKFMTGQEVRYVPRLLAAKHLIECGDLGEIFLCEAEYLGNKIPAIHGWRADPARVGSWLLEAGCHPVDILRWVAGDVVEVAGYANRSVTEVDFPGDDSHVAILKFASGCIGRMTHSAGCKRPYHIGLSIYGTRGTFDVDAGLFLEKIHGLTDFMPLPIPTAGFHPIEEEVDDFVRCILEDRSVGCDVVEGTKTIATCLAIGQSIREQRFVPVDYTACGGRGS